MHLRKLMTMVLVSIVLPIVNAGQKSDQEILEVRMFIREHIGHTVKECKKDTLGHIALPKPYSVPSLNGVFDKDMFYWDTYFTNIALISDSDFMQARNNVDNILFLIDKYGFMPNGSNVIYLDRSQPPFASMMVRDIYEINKDKKWLASACRILEKEYKFWMKQRITPTGLNRYSNHTTKDQLYSFYEYMKSRFPDLPVLADSVEILKQASHFVAEAESGWDFTPRFNFRCEDFNPVDLNANLYLYEKNFAYFYKELNKKGSDKWLKAADKRKKLLNKYCCNPQDGCFYDYDFVNNRLSPVYSSAVFNLLWSEALTPSQAGKVVENLQRLEYPCGVAACERVERERAYQWDYPNAWASFNVMAIGGLDNYGFKDDAHRIARKYVDSIVGIYQQTGNLWEKFNAEHGNLEVNNEYEMPPFMGWTAGAFIYASDYLDRTAPHPDPNFYIYLCLGQSNMEGCSPVEPVDYDNIPERFRLLPTVDFSSPTRTKGVWCDAVPPLVHEGSGISLIDYFGRTMEENLPHKGDRLHFTSHSYRVLGCRYAVEMLSLMGITDPKVKYTE